MVTMATMVVWHLAGSHIDAEMGHPAGAPKGMVEKARWDPDVKMDLGWRGYPRMVFLNKSHGEAVAQVRSRFMHLPPAWMSMDQGKGNDITAPIVADTVGMLVQMGVDPFAVRAGREPPTSR